jgi:hypothetical protein
LCLLSLGYFFEGLGYVAGNVPRDIVHGVATATGGGIGAWVRRFVGKGSVGGLSHQVFVGERDLLGGDWTVAVGGECS